MILWTTVVVRGQRTAYSVYIIHNIVGVLLSILLVISLIFGVDKPYNRNEGAQWPSGLERWLRLATGGSRPGSNPTAENFSLRNFGNSVYPDLPVSFGGDTKSRRSLLSGAYARGTKRSHQSALERITVVDSTTLREGQL